MHAADPSFKCRLSIGAMVLLAVVAWAAAQPGGAATGPPVTENPAVTPTRHLGKPGMLVSAAAGSRLDGCSLQLFDEGHEKLQSASSGGALPSIEGRVAGEAAGSIMEFFVPFDSTTPVIEPGERLILRIVAWADGGTASMEAIVTVPEVERTEPDAMLRFIGVAQEVGRIAPQAQDVGGMGDDLRQVRPSRGGTRVRLDVEAIGLRRQSLATDLRLTMSGTMTTGPEQAHDPVGSGDTRLIGQHEEPVNSSRVRFTGIEYFVRDSDRQSSNGQATYSVLSCVARCGLLQATWEGPLVATTGSEFVTDTGQTIILRDAKSGDSAAPDDDSPPEAGIMLLGEQAEAGREQLARDRASKAIPEGTTPLAARYRSLHADGLLDGGSALIDAAATGDVDAVQVLLDLGVPPGVEGSGGRRPLHVAAAGGHETVVRMLLSRGADGSTTNDETGGADVDNPALVTPRGGSAGLFSSDYDPEHDEKQGAEGTGAEDAYVDSISFDRFVDRTRNEMDVNAVDAQGHTALHLAAAGGHEAVVALLLGAGADVHATAADGATVLHLAAAAGRAGLVRTLLARGADPEARRCGILRPIDVAGGDEVRQALAGPRPPRSGEEGMIERTIVGFMSALQLGQRGGLTIWLTPEAAAGFPDRPAPMSVAYRIERIDLDDAGAVARLFMKLRDPPTGAEPEIDVRMQLRRAPQGWLISALDVQPHFAAPTLQEDASW